MSDPYAIIRRLVKMVELLKEQQQQQQQLGVRGLVDGEGGHGGSGGITPNKTMQVLQRELTECEAALARAEARAESLARRMEAGTADERGWIA